MALSALRPPSSRYIQMHILPMYENLYMHHVIQPEKKLSKSLMLTLMHFGPNNISTRLQRKFNNNTLKVTIPSVPAKPKQTQHELIMVITL
jgi:hypothetical protein